MSEVFSQNYENINNKEGIQEQNIPSFNGIEDNIRQNYENNSTKQGAENIALKQYQEQQQLKEQKESPVLQEAREGLDKEAMINEAKTMLYEKLGIDENQNNNSSFENFTKGVIDGGILDNYDLALQIWETNGKIILDGLEQLASWEGLKNLANAIKEDIWTLFTGNAYEKGKVSAEVVLTLITAGAGLAVNATRKGIKLGIKEISKLRVNKERLVNSPDVKEVVGKTNNKVAEIVPKQEINLDEISKRSFDNERQVKGLEELGISESFSRDMLESGILTPLPNVEKFDLLKRFEFFEKKGIDYKTMIDDAIVKTPNLTEKDALLIFSYTDYFLYGKLNGFMRGDKQLINGMTKGNIEATNRIINDLEKALEKMPNIDGKLIYRGDSWGGWKKEIGEKIELKSFTSVANNIDETFLSERNNILITVEGKYGRVKDITELAIIPKFGNDFPQIPRTTNEGIILPNSVVKIIDNVNKKIKGVVVDEIKVKQIK